VVASVNVATLDVFEDGAVVNADALKQRRVLRGRFDVLKILGDGELTRKLTVHAHRFSRAAIEKIEKAGGTAVVLTPPVRREAAAGEPARAGKPSRPTKPSATSAKI
jgi:large subunit ribosomal protein L15